MIVGERKPFEEITSLIEGYENVLLAGCGTCVKVCFTGGDKEVAVLASQLRINAAKQRTKLSVSEITVERQCEIEFVDEIAAEVDKYDIVLSTACGAGVQMLANRFPGTPVVPAVNTTFLGLLEKQGLFIENCRGCGDCVLGRYGGICPVTRCAKSIMNGPCGGSKDGMCEVNPETPCAWQLIIDRLTALDRLDLLREVPGPKDWSSDHHGGPRKLIREDNIL